MQFKQANKKWGELSRATRKLAVIRHKNQIASEADFFGGEFFSDTGTENSAYNDIVFLSERSPLDFFNATVLSGPSAYFEHCDDLASEASRRLVPPVTPSHPDPKERARQRQLRNADELALFGGIARHEWIKMESARLADSGDVFLHPSSALDSSFSRGIGLTIVSASMALSAEIIENLIFTFREHGEAARVDPSVRIQYSSAQRSLIYSDASLIEPGKPSFISARREKAAIELSLPSANGAEPSRRRGMLL